MSTEERYLCFTVGKEEFAVKLMAVREVIAMPEVTAVPQSPSYFLGIMNLRGQVISVIDMRTKLGFKPEKGTETAAIIFDIENIKIGVVVDSINSVMSAKSEDISAKPDIAGNASRHDFITNVYRKNDHLILIVDISKALSIEDIKAAQKSAKRA